MQRPCSSVVIFPSSGSGSSSWSSQWAAGSSSPSRCPCPGSSPTTSWRQRKRPWWSKDSIQYLFVFRDKDNNCGETSFQPLQTGNTWCSSHARLMEQIGFYFNQYSCLHRPHSSSRFTLGLLYVCERGPKSIFTLQVYFFPIDYSDCVLGSERRQNVGDLHSIVCLKASYVDTDGAVKLLLSCYFHYLGCVGTALDITLPIPTFIFFLDI